MDITFLAATQGAAGACQPQRYAGRHTRPGCITPRTPSWPRDALAAALEVPLVSGERRLGTGPGPQRVPRGVRHRAARALARVLVAATAVALQLQFIGVRGLSWGPDPCRI